MRNYGFSWLTDMRVLVGRLLHIGAKSTLKMSYLGCFWFSFCQLHMLNKRRHNSAGWTSMHMFHGHTRRSCAHSGSFKLFLSGKLCFLWITCICTKFDHLESLVGFRSILHRALNNNEMVLIFVCFAFLMCIHRDEECYMTKGNTTVGLRRCKSWLDEF